MTLSRAAPILFRPFLRHGGSSERRELGHGGSFWPPQSKVVDYSKHIQKAEEATRRRNYDFAIELYQQLLEIEPDQGDARAGLRKALKLRAEQKKGGKLFAKIGGAGPLAAAKTMVKAKRWDSAIKSLEKFLAGNPLDVSANLLLGECCENAEHFHSACAVYEFIAEIAPKNSEGLRRAGAMMYRTGDHVRALEFYERALEIDPRDQDAIKARKDLAAETALSQGRYESVGHSREQMKDKEEAASLERGQRIHKSEDELREELERLESRLAENASDPDLLKEIAEHHRKLKDLEAALEFLERAMEYRRDSFDLANEHGQLKVKVLKKRIAKADKLEDSERANKIEAELKAFEISFAQSLLTFRPGDSGLRLELAKKLLRSGDHDGAISELQQVTNDPRTERDARFFLGQAFHAKGFSDLARKEFKQALQDEARLDDRGKEILYNLASIAEAAGEAEEARSYYSQVFEVDISYRDVAQKMESFK